MKANEVKVENFLSLSETAFIIPVYQRNYDWEKSQCKQLFQDILTAGIDGNVHFIGSIVFVHDDVYTTSGIKELTIIDGQQRLTTLTLLYAAMYHFAEKQGDQRSASKYYEHYLVNKFEPEDEKLKLKTTENNKTTLRQIIHDGIKEDLKTSNLVNNFKFFVEVINETNIETIRKGLAKLIFVEIGLDRQNDNPQRIFESLNSTGLALSEGDLIRNYVLMGLKPDNQTTIYNNYWDDIEQLTRDEADPKTSKLSEFIRDYLTLETRKIPNKNKVYADFKAKYPTSADVKDLETYLSKMKSLAKYYNKLVNPANEPDKEIRRQLDYIRKLEINVVHPFLMKVYEDFSNKVITKTEFLEILHFLQSFVWRRFMLALPTSALNKIFMALYDKIKKENYVKSMQMWLLTRTGVQRFPKDKEVLEALKTKDLYNIQSKNRSYLFDKLENFDNKEPVNILENPDITIEHIFPQKPTDKWKAELGEKECKFIEETYLNTISNLSISGNNTKLGNKTFAEKRDAEKIGYRDSRLWLNKHLATVEKWDRKAIEKRFDLLANRFLHIWKYPNIVITDGQIEQEISIFEAESPTNKKLDYAIFLDEKLDVKTVAKLYTSVIKILFEKHSEEFFKPKLTKKINLAKDKTQLRSPEPLGNLYFIETHGSSNDKFDRIKQALTECGYEEDDLLIKYADAQSKD